MYTVQNYDQNMLPCSLVLKEELKSDTGGEPDKACEDLATHPRCRHETLPGIL